MTMLQERNRLLNMALFFSIRTLIAAAPFFAANKIAKFIHAFLFPRYSLKGLFEAYSWFLFNVRWIRMKRMTLRNDFRRDEREVLSCMTAWLTNGESIAGRLINRTAVFYCRLVGLRTIEIARKQKR